MRALEIAIGLAILIAGFRLLHAFGTHYELSELRATNQMIQERLKEEELRNRGQTAKPKSRFEMDYAIAEKSKRMQFSREVYEIILTLGLVIALIVHAKSARRSACAQNEPS